MTIRTITYNPETHRLVPIEPSEEMLRKATKVDLGKDCDEKGICINLYQVIIAAAPQPEQVESEPVAYYTNQGNWPRIVLAIDGNSDGYETPLYASPQPDRTAELTAERDAALDTIASYKQQLSVLAILSQYPPLYEELRSVIDGGSESMDHAQAVQEVKDLQSEITTLKAALKVARDALDTCQWYSPGGCWLLDPDKVEEALAKINEVLKP